MNATTPQHRMHAIVHRKYGTPDVLTYEEIARPVPGDEDVHLLVVHAGPDEHGRPGRHGARGVLDRAPRAAFRAVGRIRAGGSDPVRGSPRAGLTRGDRPRDERRRRGHHYGRDDDEGGAVHLARVRYRS